MKISVEQKSQRYAVQIKLEEKEIIDKYSYGVLTNNNFEELADVNQMQIDDNRMLIYSFTAEKPISEWLSKQHNEYELMLILNSIIKAFETSESSGLPENCFLLNEKYILVNEKRASAKLIYLPLSNYKSSEKPENIFKYIIENFVIDSSSKIFDELKSSDCSIKSIKSILEESSGKMVSQKIERVFVENENVNIAPMSGRKDFVMDHKGIKSSVEIPRPKDERNNNDVSNQGEIESVTIKSDVKYNQAIKRDSNIRATNAENRIEIPGGMSIPGQNKKEKSSKIADNSKQQKKSSHINLTEMLINMIKNAKEKKCEKDETKNNAVELQERSDIEIPGLQKPVDGNNSNKKKSKKNNTKKKKQDVSAVNKKPASNLSQTQKSQNQAAPTPFQIPSQNNSLGDYESRTEDAYKAREAQMQKAEEARRAHEAQAQKAEEARKAHEAQAQKAEETRRAHEVQPSKNDETSRQEQAQRELAARRAREAMAQKSSKNIHLTNSVNNEENIVKQKPQDIREQRNEIIRSAESETQKEQITSVGKSSTDLVDVKRDETDGSLRIYVNISQSELGSADFSLKNNNEKSIATRLYPKIVRVKTDIATPVNKAVFKIGKEKGAVDYYIDNPVISRLHAMICCREGKYYIVDTKSTNKTYLNGNPCRSNYDYELSNGDIIKMANEEFKFLFD